MIKKTIFILVFTILGPGEWVTGQNLSLEACRQLSLENNKKIKIAIEHEKSLEALKKSAKTQFLPNFSFNGGYMRMNKQISLLNEDLFLPIVPSEVYQNGFEVLLSDPALLAQYVETTDVFGTTLPLYDDEGNLLFKEYAYIPSDQLALDLKNVFLLNVGMVQPIYTGGKIKAVYDLAKTGEELFSAKKNLTESEVLLKTDEFYWKIISLQEKVRLAKDYKKMIDSLLTDIENIYSEGIITQNELLKVKVKMNEAELNLLKARNGLKLARMVLNQSMGMPLDTIVQLEDSLIMRYNMASTADYLNLALKDRPEVEILNKSIDMVKTGEKLMKSRYMPNIGLTANYMWMNPNPYNAFEEEFGSDWNVGVVVNVPIFHWGDKKHTLNAARHERKAAEHKLEETKELIELQVNQSVFTYNESFKKVEITRVSLDQAQVNLDITKDNYQEGIVNTSDLLEAQTLWQEAYTDYIEAMTEHKRAESELKNISGQLTKKY